MKIILHQKQVYFNANHRTITTDNRTLSTLAEYCEKLVKSDRLPNLHCGGSIESTTKHNGGYRSHNTSGIFLPKIHTLNTATSGRCVSIEFVARATLRNKAGNRTNKGGYHPLWLVVEPLPRLLSVSKLSLNNITENFTMLFKFLLLGEKRLTVRIRAKSETEALQRIQFTSQAICIARFSDNLTACNRPNFGEMGEVVHSPMVDGHAYSTSTNGVSATEQKTILHPFALIGYSAPVVAKSTASREKLNDETLANSSTPLTRAFFVRSLRTPKENALSVLLSMVGRIGQRLGVGCVPKFAVSHPDTSYRPAVRSQAVARKSNFGAITMLFKFLCVNRAKHTYNQEIITIQADTEENARFQLSADYRLLLDRPIAKVSQNLTACKHSPMGEVSEIVHSPMVDGHAYSTSTNGVSNTEQKTILHPLALIGYSAPVVAKSTA